MSVHSRIESQFSTKYSAKYCAATYIWVAAVDFE